MDQIIEEVAAVSGPLKKYKVKRGDFVTVMKLSDEDAKKLGVGPDNVVGGASTIQPVQPVEDSDDGGEGDGSAVVVGDAGAGAQPVQPSADSGGDGQAPGDAPPQGDGPEAQVSPTDDSAQGQAKASAGSASAKPAVKKAAAPAKRRTTSANKARSTSATKADG
ncbi:hypothetical protein [Streptomyces ipomoeae]|uniref:hypothetical protein n=1 Tax=Streptomyces ipomoeae TaxID=103232 RepID=UPI0029BA95EB|nr:hypothetical protein [Streptomyces ipomoeae]MDX2694955.1 hypothetical protein [Streptomyces ipomoeae]MDX2840834.1 hypothetical protein [Streptomyces ipomoeae]